MFVYEKEKEGESVLKRVEKNERAIVPHKPESVPIRLGVPRSFVQLLEDRQKLFCYFSAVAVVRICLYVSLRTVLPSHTVHYLLRHCWTYITHYNLATTLSFWLFRYGPSWWSRRYKDKSCLDMYGLSTFWTQNFAEMMVNEDHWYNIRLWTSAITQSNKTWSWAG